MKKIFILLLLFFHLSVSSQEIIENWSHPFQVLFVDSATYIGIDEPVIQFDFISKYDLLDIAGDIVLVHYTGRVTEMKDIKLNVRELASIHHKDEPFERPTFSDPSSYINKSKNEIKYSFQNCVESYINLIYPQQDNYGTAHVNKSEDLFFSWELAELFEQDNTTFTIKNIFDEIILERRLNTNSIEIAYEDVSLEEDIFIVKISVQSKYGMEVSDEYGVYLDESLSKVDRKKKFNDILKALSADWNTNDKVANVFYQKAIQSSSNDPRFIKLYHDFLERHPEFKK